MVVLFVLCGLIYWIDRCYGRESSLSHDLQTFIAIRFAGDYIGLPHAQVIEIELAHLLAVEQIATVDDDRIAQRLADAHVALLLELIPLGQPPIRP